MGIEFIFFALCAGYAVVRLLFQVDDRSTAVWIFVLGVEIAAFSFLIAQRLVHKHVQIYGSRSEITCIGLVAET